MSLEQLCNQLDGLPQKERKKFNPGKTRQDCPPPIIYKYFDTYHNVLA